jgi:GcrA cell cycle regulator
MDEQTSQLDVSVALVEESISMGPPPQLESRALAPGKRKLVTTMTLTSDTCKWPFGDPASPDFHYCGRAPQSGRPYCATHEAISRPSSLRKR